jgi:uncharacterized membrane protein YcaP (DUF421 family)
MTLGDHLDLSATSALAVVVTTTVMYLLLVLLLRRWGARLSASRSSRSTATIVVLGAIVGRASLGLTPDLEAGLLALVTVLTVMTVLGLRGPTGASGGVAALVVAGRFRDEALRRHHLSEADVWTGLRLRGIGSLNTVALALLEPGGEISVIAAGSPLERRAVADVRDADQLPASLFGPA